MPSSEGEARSLIRLSLRSKLVAGAQRCNRAIHAAPNPHSAVGFQGDARSVIGRNLNHIGETADLHGAGLVDLRALAELPVIIAPPSPHRTIGFACQAV